MKTHGLQVDSIHGDFRIKPVQATDDSASVREVDAVLVCVKAWQLSGIIASLRKMVGENTLVIPLENGISSLEYLKANLNRGHILGGTCWISSYVAKPGYIRHVGVDPVIAFGELDYSKNKQAEIVQKAFRKVGVNALIPNDIVWKMWEKYVFITPVSGMGAITRVPIGIVRSMPETRKLLIQAVEEIVSLGMSLEVNFPRDVMPRTLAFIEKMPFEMTTSFQRDISDGRPSELVALIGCVVHRGRELVLSVPLHEFIYASLLPQEMQAREAA